MSTSIVKDLSPLDTIISVQNDLDFPDMALIQIGPEQISYTQRYKNTLYGCLRGINGTLAASHKAGAEVTINSYYTNSEVSTLQVDCESHITGDIKIVSGENIAITQAGQEITVNALLPEWLPGIVIGDPDSAGPGYRTIKIPN